MRFFRIPIMLTALISLTAATVWGQETVNNPVSEFPVIVDGQFSGGFANGNLSGEWSDVIPLAFHSPTRADAEFRATTRGSADTNSLLYVAVAPGISLPPEEGIEDLYLMYDYLPRTRLCAPGDQGQEIARVTFPVRDPREGPGPAQAGDEETVISVVGRCAPEGGPRTGVGISSSSIFECPTFFEVDFTVLFDDGTEVPADSVGVGACAGLGGSTLSTVPHLIVELEVELNIPPGFGDLDRDGQQDPNEPFPPAGINPATGRYDPDPKFWTSSFAKDQGDPPATSALFQINPNGSTTANNNVIVNTVAEIDIKPGEFPNRIRRRKEGGVTVAILGTADFDASTTDSDTVEFASEESECSEVKDVNSDGKADWVGQFEVEELNLSKNATFAILTGRLTDGTTFAGTDSVLIVKTGSNEQLLCPQEDDDDDDDD